MKLQNKQKASLYKFLIKLRQILKMINNFMNNVNNRFQILLINYLDLVHSLIFQQKEIKI